MFWDRKIFKYRYILGIMVNTSKELGDLFKARGVKMIEPQKLSVEEIAELDSIHDSVNHYLEHLRRFEYDSRRNAPNIIIY